MTSGTLHAITAADGPAALPRLNGELVFQAPWESRAFGVAIALHDAGAIDYEVFRSRLIAEIAAHALGHGTGEDGSGYYERWLDALQHVLVEREIVSQAEIGERAAEIAHAWAHDHGHGHDHHHDHDHPDGEEGE
jgi:nitrile hydratase accessory protein